MPAVDCTKLFEAIAVARCLVSLRVDRGWPSLVRIARYVGKSVITGPDPLLWEAAGGQAEVCSTISATELAWRISKVLGDEKHSQRKTRPAAGASLRSATEVLADLLEGAHETPVASALLGTLATEGLAIARMGVPYVFSQTVPAYRGLPFCVGREFLESPGWGTAAGSVVPMRRREARMSFVVDTEETLRVHVLIAMEGTGDSSASVLIVGSEPFQVHGPGLHWVSLIVPTLPSRGIASVEFAAPEEGRWSIAMLYIDLDRHPPLNERFLAELKGAISTTSPDSSHLPLSAT